MNKGLLGATVAIGMLVLSTGCALPSQPHYHWGEYEQLIYDSYNNPEQVSLTQQISVLERDVALASESGAPIPPGLFVQLGVAYSKEGELSKALACFEREVSLYPDAKIFVGKLIENVNRSPSSAE